MCDDENLKLEAHVQVCWEAHGEAVCLVTDDRAVSPVSSFHPLTAPHPHSVPFLILSKENIRLTLYILLGWVHQTPLTLLLQMSAVISQAIIWQRWVETAFRKVFWRTLCSVRRPEVRWRKCLLVVWLWGIAIIAPSAGKSTITITIWCMTIIAS